MRKKILLAFITITLAGTLTACGGAEEKETKNNTSSVQSEKTDDAKGDGSIIPQSVTIDGVKYTKDSKIEDFLDHGWSIEGYDKEQEVEETRFTLTKDDKEINVTAYADETTAVLKERTIDVVYAVNLSGKNDVEFKLSNGIALGESNKIIDEIYELKLPTRNQGIKPV